MTLQGKGFFTYILKECEGGDPAAILATAQAAGLSHMLIKIADGTKPFGIDADGKDFTAPVVQALRAAGIAVWGWHYIRGNDPTGEANTAVARTQALSLDGYVLDAEEEYKESGKEASARQFMAAIEGALTVPIALSSFRFPNYHPELPWSTFLEKCDYHMPQVYWEQAHNAGDQLRESKRQCDALPNARPYIPTGAAYGVTGWAPTQADISDFLDTARELDLPAVNFFQWAYCREHLPQIWTQIAQYDWTATPQPPSPPIPEPPTPPEPEPPVPPEPEPEPPTPPTPEPPPAPAEDAFATQFLAALNSQKAGQAAALYDPNAVRVWGDEILRSLAAIQGGFAIFFASLPVGTTFKLSGVEADDDLRFVTWKAGTLAGETTLILKNSKIMWDYTFLD